MRNLLSRLKSILFYSFFLSIILTTVFGQRQLNVDGNDRIGWSADGNKHDPDDWGASAMALAIFAKAGWQNKLVHIDYNNWLPTNDSLKSSQEQITVLEGLERFEFKKTKAFDDQTNLEEAIQNVVKEINKRVKKVGFGMFRQVLLKSPTKQ